MVYGQMGQGMVRADGHCDNCAGRTKWFFIRAEVLFICTQCGRAYSDKRYRWLND